MNANAFEPPRAPKDITPEKFFNQWLPEQISGFQEIIKGLAGDVSFSISTRVTGDGGGDWTADIENGEVKFSSGVKEDALVTFILNKQNFIEAVTGERDELRMQPPGGGGGNPAAMVGQAKENMAALRDISGSIKWVVDDESKPFEATIKFAGPITPEPTATVVVDLDTMKEMASGSLNPQSAFMAGRIQISGDMTILMQLTPLMMM